VSPRYEHVTPHGHWAQRPDRVSRGAAAILWRRNPVWALPLRHYRVSHLGAHAAQEEGHLPGRDRSWRGPGSGRQHVVRVVRASHGAIPAPPPAAARRMALALTGRHPAGPLASADPGIGMKECLAARTAVAADSGHRSPPRVRRTRYLSRKIPLRMNAERWGADDSGRYHSVEEESGRCSRGMTRTRSPLVMNIVAVVESGHVESVAPTDAPVRGGPPRSSEELG
jgi:hypothetical protein